jgi:hypothetical protein
MYQVDMQASYLGARSWNWATGEDEVVITGDI